MPQRNFYNYVTWEAVQPYNIIAFAPQNYYVMKVFLNPDLLYFIAHNLVSDTNPSPIIALSSPPLFCFHCVLPLNHFNEWQLVFQIQ
jgi:hypothetical protein